MGKYMKYSLFLFSIILIIMGLLLGGRKITILNKKRKAPIRTFELIATPNYSDITKPNVFLDWSNYGSGDETVFKGYQSKDNGNTWESISLMSYTSVKQVKVLNVYPEQGDGLKSWMEVAKDSKTGEVIGKGIIKVDKIGISNFNRNPSAYLKKSGADWNYDVVVFGFWDRNNYYDLSAASKTLIDTYIKDGKGVIFGHDTGTNNSFSTKSTRVFDTDTENQYKYGQDNFTYFTNKYLPMHWEEDLYVGSTEIEITKKGLLTQFPWDLGPVGTKYIIPSCHSWGQVLDDTSNVWMKFVTTETVPGSNFYIVSNNNVSMIQTGHTSGQSMEAEQKILANLMFYGYQLTSDTNVTDYSGMDLTAPNTPTVEITGDYNGINIKTSSTDKGSTYKYYIEGYTKPDLTVITSKSNTAEVTVITGIKGYYYVIDNQAVNNFSISNATYTADGNIPLNISNDGKYIHVKAVDKYDNISETTNAKIQLDKYDLTLKLNGGQINGDSSDKINSYYLNQVSSLPTPSRGNYLFNKWTKSDDCLSIIDGNNYTTKNSCVLNAAWNEDFNNNGIDDNNDPKYKITYTDGLNQTIFADQIDEVLEGLNTPSFRGNTKRDKYIFYGWNPKVSSKVNGNITYVAVWEEDFNGNGIADKDEEKYTITYRDGVEDSAFSPQVFNNQLKGLVTPSFNGSPKREKYVFIRWNPEVAEKIQGNAIYTAVWEEDFNGNGIADKDEEKYTITYRDNVNNEVFKEEVYANLLKGIKTPKFTGNTSRESYVFMGWSPSFSETVEKNIVYIATWADDKNNDGIPDSNQEKYTVKYIDNCNQESFKDYLIDNILPGMNTPVYDGVPVRKDYVFVGWNPLVKNIVTETVTYKAQWKEDKNHNGIPDDDDPKYKVTFKDGMNGRIFKEFSIDVLEGTKVPKIDSSILKNESYEFVGWNNSTDMLIVSDTIFIANWNYILRDVPDTTLNKNKGIILLSLIIIAVGSIVAFINAISSKNVE